KAYFFHGHNLRIAAGSAVPADHGIINFYIINLVGKIEISSTLTGQAGVHAVATTVVVFHWPTKPRFHRL
ncbi:MAG: hypothetical protein OEW45_10255, partial [Deltaproteobacteria bacterium]|nr:hypothetical protein [Deltaproteobacteria bacterium]